MAVHRKATPLMEPMEAMARLAARAQSRAEAAQTRASGSASYDNGDGTRTVIGPQAGGATMATHVGDVTPPGRPTGVAGASSAGVVYIAWGGELDGGIPDDFDHVSLYMSVEGASELVGTLREAGIVSTVPMATTATVEVWATAEDDACLADGTSAHNVSAESDHAAVAVTQAADADAVAGLLGTVTELSRTKMLMATCGTDAATAAKEAVLASGTLDLVAGATVTVVFAHANTEPAPTLDVGGTGARPLRTAGLASAYWADGQAVVLTYDGSCWQVCSTPVYASTVTVGNPGGANVLVDADSASVRSGSVVLAKFGAKLVELGRNSQSATISMLAGLATIVATKLNGVAGISISSGTVDVRGTGGGGVRLYSSFGGDSNHASVWSALTGEVPTLYAECSDKSASGSSAVTNRVTMSPTGFSVSNKAAARAALGITLPIPVSNGGTGATDAAGARRNLGFSTETKTWSNLSGLKAWREGRLVTVALNGTVNFSSEWAKSMLATLPTGWRPAYDVYAPVSAPNQTKHFCTFLKVSTAGAISVECYGGYNPGSGYGWAGTLTYVATK